MARLVVVVKGVERGNLISQGFTVNSVLLSSVPQLRTPAPRMVLSGLNFRSGVNAICPYKIMLFSNGRGASCAPKM